MKVRVETVSPDGLYVYLDGPICVMTWDELLVLLKMLDQIISCKNIENLTLVTKQRGEE